MCACPALHLGTCSSRADRRAGRLSASNHCFEPWIGLNLVRSRCVMMPRRADAPKRRLREQPCQKRADRALSKAWHQCAGSWKMLKPPACAPRMVRNAGRLMRVGAKYKLFLSRHGSVHEVLLLFACGTWLSGKILGPQRRRSRFPRRLVSSSRGCVPVDRVGQCDRHY